MTAKTAAVCLLFVLFGTFPVFGQAGFQGHNLEHNLVFPDFVIGGGFSTEIFLLNPKPGATVNGTLVFYKQDGTPLEVLTDPQGALTVSQIGVSLPPGGSQFVKVYAPTPDLTIGWALLDVAPPASGQEDLRTRVSGSVLYRNGEGAATVASVGVVAGNYQIGEHKRISIPVVVQGDTINTGVALVNAGANPLTVNFELRNTQGTVVQSAATINPSISPLAPGHQVARFVTEIFQTFGFENRNFHGSLLLSTEQEGLEAIGLLETNLLLTSIPVVHFAPATSAQTHDVTNSGFSFSPATVTITVGDSVNWTLASIHDVLEVTQATWNANGATGKTGGFSTPFGGGTVQFNTAGTYYYVCEPHAASGMKGRVIVNPAQ